MKAFALLFKLTRLFICLDGNHRGYQKSAMMQLLLLLYQKRVNLPTWQMAVGSISVFNEEAGETSFSRLAQVVLGDTLKADFEHMDKMYKLTREYATTSDVYREEQGRTKRKNGYYLLTDKNTEKATVAMFMLEKIRAITLNNFTEYQGEAKKNNPAYVPNANLTQPYVKQHRFWVANVLPQALNTMAQYRKACTGTWAKEAGLHLLWPSFDNELRVLAVQGNQEALMEARERRDRGNDDDVDYKHEATEEDEDSSEEDEAPVLRGTKETTTTESWTTAAAAQPTTKKKPVSKGARAVAATAAVAAAPPGPREKRKRGPNKK